jgi:hypothetical protein
MSSCARGGRIDLPTKGPMDIEGQSVAHSDEGWED